MKVHTMLKKLLKPLFSLKKKVKNNPLIFLLVAYVIFRIFKLCNRVEGFESKPASFDQDVSGGKKLVWFYADWCGHCKRMKKEWDTASNKVNGKMVKIDLGDDNSETKKISEKYNINGFPTILLLNNGEKEDEYTDDRTSNAFESYCNNIH